MIRLVIGLVPHHRSLAVSTTAPSASTESILYGPDDGNRLVSMSGFSSQMVFHASAMRDTAAGSPPSSVVVTSRPSSSPMTWDGISDVAVNNWL